MWGGGAFGGKFVFWVGCLNFKGIWRSGVEEQGGARTEDGGKKCVFLELKEKQTTYIVKFGEPMVATLYFITVMPLRLR